jgi:hypothetical protein
MLVVQKRFNTILAIGAPQKRKMKYLAQNIRQSIKRGCKELNHASPFSISNRFH